MTYFVILRISLNASLLFLNSLLIQLNNFVIALVFSELLRFDAIYIRESFLIIFKIDPVNCSLRSELFYDFTQPLKFMREIPIMIYSIKIPLTFWTKILFIDSIHPIKIFFRIDFICLFNTIYVGNKNSYLV